MKICIAGKNDIAVECLEYTKAHIDAKNVLVLPVSDDDGVNRWNASLLKAAKDGEVRIVELKDLYEIEDLIFFSLQYDIILDPDQFKSDKLFNIHFSLLPEYRGVNTTILPILHGKTYSGVTLHKINKGIDTGDIIAQVQIPIQDNTTSRSLYFKCMEEGTALFKNYFCNIYRNEIQPKPQSAERSRYFNKTTLDYSKATISCKQTAFQVQRMVHAFCFREYQLPKFEGASIRKAEILKSKSSTKPGTILSQNEKMYTVSTVDFDIALHIDHYSEFVQSIKKNDNSAIKKLLPLINNINETNKEGKTPLMLAAQYCDKEIVKLLIEKGADIGFCDKDARTALDYANNRRKNTAIIQILEKYSQIT